MGTKTKQPDVTRDEIIEMWVGPIIKTEKTADGLMVYGKATGPDLDLDQQICDPAWLKKAMPDWMVWGNVREQHSAIAAGVGKELTEAGDDWMLKALVVDPVTIKKVETGVLKGYSIKIGRPRVVVDKTAKGGRIVDGFIPEVSLVDRPCNPDAWMAIAKAEGAALAPVNAAGVVLVKFDGAEAEPVEQATEPGAVEVAPEPEVLSDDEQMAADALADKEKALAGTPVPGPDENSDGAGEMFAAAAAVLAPSAYRKAVATAGKVLSGDIVKRAADEADDIAGAQAIITQLAALIISEATELAAGRMEEADDIACLMDAVRAVKYFIWAEREQDGREVPGDTTMAGIQLAVSADATKSATMPIEDVVATAVPDVTELVKAAVAEANRASEDRYKAIEAELAKVRAMPIPGGPMILPTAGTGAPAQTSPEQTLIKRYRLMSEQAGDPNVQRAYRDLAETLATT